MKYTKNILNDLKGKWKNRYSLTIFLTIILGHTTLQASPQCLALLYKERLSGTWKENTDILYGSCTCPCTGKRTSNNRCLTCYHTKLLNPEDAHNLQKEHSCKTDQACALFSQRAAEFKMNASQ